MNKIFKVVWSKTKECYVVVSEVAKNNGGKKKVLASVLAGLAMVGAGAMGTPVHADVNLGNSAVNISPNGTYNGSNSVGKNSVVVGYQNTTNNQDGTIAIGMSNTATENSAMALGNGNKAIGGAAVAMGAYNQAKGRASVAIGNVSMASGEDSIAIGNRANSNPANQDLGSGQFSIAMGRESWARGTDNISIGHNAKTDSSGDSIAIGRDSTSNSVNTVTIGAQTKATGGYAVAIGRESEVNANFATAMGYQSKAKGSASIAIGKQNNSNLGDTITMGNSNTANTMGGIAIGKNNTADSSIGDPTTANKENSQIAIGLDNKATSLDTVAIGREVKSTKTGAVAMGNRINASGDYAVAIGNSSQGGTVEAGDYAVAVGFKAKATGGRSIAQGGAAEAAANASIAMGLRSKVNAQKATSNYEFSGSNGTLSPAGYNTETITVNSAGAPTTGAVAGNYYNAGSAIAVGENATVSDESDRAVVVGADAKTNGNAHYSVVLGSGSHADASDGFVAGHGSYVKSRESIAIGSGANVSGTENIRSQAIGFGATVTGTGAYDATAIGATAQVNGVQGGVALGSGSLLSRTTNSNENVGFNSKFVDGTKVRNRAYEATVNALGEQWDAGAQLGAVSVGNDDQKRQIINVAAGNKDTDAVNVAQLKNVGVRVGADTNTATITVGTNTSNVAADFLAYNGQLNIKGDNNRVTTVSENDANGKDANVNVKFDYDGLVKAKAGSSVTVNQKTEGGKTVFEIDAAAGGATSTEKVQAKADVAGSSDKNIAKVAPKAGENFGDVGATYEVNVSRNDVKDAAREAVTVNNGGTTKADGSYTADSNNPISVTPTKDDTNHNTSYAVTFDGNKAAKQIPLTYKANGNGAKTVTLEKGLDFTNGTNTTAEIGNDGVVKYNLNKDVDLSNTGSLKVGGTTVNNGGITIKAPTTPGTTTTDVKLTNTGLDNGGNTITNVAEGQNNTDAVNVKQLKANRTEVKAGDNVVVTTDADATDNHTIYTVNAVTPAVYTTPNGEKLTKDKDGKFHKVGEAAEYTGDIITSFENPKAATGQTTKDGSMIVNNIGSAIKNQTPTMPAGQTATYLDKLKAAADAGSNVKNAAVNVSDLHNTAEALKASELHIAPTTVKTGSTEAKGGVVSGTENIYKYDATSKKVTLTYNDGNGKAVTDTKAVIDFSDLNTGGTTASSWNVKSSANTTDGGAVGDNHDANAQNIADAKTVEFQSGKNLVVKQTNDTTNGNATVEFSLSDNIVAGKDGANGKDGSVGATGKDGSSVVLNGKDGSIGMTGPKGQDGKDGINGRDGADISITSAKGEQVLVNRDPANNGDTDKAERIVYVPKDANGDPIKGADGKNIVREVATMDDGLKFTGNNESTENKQKLGSLVKVKGEGTKEGTDAAGTGKEIQTSDGTKFESAADNIAVEADGTDTLTVKLNKNLKGLDSVTTKEVKLGDANDNISIKKAGDRITYSTDGGTTVNKVANLADELHITPGSYEVGATDKDANAKNDEVTLTYTDGNSAEKANTFAKIKGVAKSDLSNITDAGKKVITGLGTVVKAGDNVTVSEVSDATTGRTTYTVNAVTPAVYTKADGTKVVKRPDGTFTTNVDGAPGNDVPASDVIVSIQDAAGNTTGGNSIVNNVGSAIDKTGTSTGDTFLTNLNNAATDNPFAAVNVRDLKSTADALKASELHIAPTAVKAGSTEAKGGVASGAENVYKYDAATKKVTLTYNDGNGKAVTDTKAVIDFSDLNVPASGNNYGFKANATANGGTVEGTATETAVENGGTVNFAAGKNLTVKQEVDAANKTYTYTYSLDKDLTNLDKVVVNGKDGVAGKDGVTIVGPQGATGATGIPGTNGIDGKVGITGKDGKDAVSIAGKDGVGTIGLTGPQGPAGTNGKSVDISTENGTKTLVKPEANNNDQSQRIVYVPKDANGNPLKDADNNDIKREVATMDDGLKFTGNNESTENKQKLGSLVKVQGEGTKEGADATGAKEIQTSDGTKFESAKDNIAVEADGANTLTVKLNKDLKGLDSVTTKEVKLGDANDNISIKKDGDRITYTTPGSTDTHKVATLDDEMYIKDTTYTVDANKKVTLTYVDGNSKDVAGKKAIIDLSGLPVGDKDTDMRIKEGDYTAKNGSVTLNTVDKDGNPVAGKDVVIKGINTNNYQAGDNVTFTNNGTDANGNPIVKINAEVSTEQVVAKAGNDNLATVAPATGSTQGGKNATYEVNVDKTNLENKAEISYKANGGTAQKTTLANGFNFTSDDNSVAITTGANGKVNFKVDTTNIQGKAFNLDVDKEGTGKVETAQTAAATPSVEKGTKFVAGNNLSIRHDGINGDANYDHQVTYALNSDLKGITSITNNGGATMNFGPNEVSITGGNLNMGGNKITNVKNGTDKSDVATVGQLTKVTSNDNTVAINKTTDADGAPVYDLSVQGGGHDPRVDQLGEEVGRVGAQGAALAALKPIQYDPLEPTQIMAGYGNYRGNSAIAMGVAHYKNESTLMHAGVSWAGGSRHMMANAGVTWKVGNRDSEAAVADRYRKGPISSAYAMQQEMASVKAQNAGLKTEVSDLKAENEQMKAQIAAMMAKLGM